MAFLEILKDDILQLNFYTFIGSWAQFEELHEPFVDLRAHLPPKDNSPYFFHLSLSPHKKTKKIYNMILIFLFSLLIDSIPV